MRLLLLLLLCTLAAHADEARPVALSLKTPDGKPFAPAAKFHVFDDTRIVSTGNVEQGRATLRLEPLPEPQRFSLWLEPNAKIGVPGKIWHGLEVKKDGATNWELTVPPVAAVQGRIVLADGRPAANCSVAMQSGTRAGFPKIRFIILPTWLARGAHDVYAATTTAADGSFTLDGLVPGQHALDVYEPQAKRWFTIPFAPALDYDAAQGVPTKIGTWTVPENGWDWLFDTQLRHGGEPSKFEGQGEVKNDGGVLRLGTGQDLTGVTWTENLPRENYEISLDARRAEGSDFFCGLTFPIGDAPLTWIVGGWGGTIVGLSNVNGDSAAENETTQNRTFENGRWYRLRLRVSKPKVEAWIDDDKVIDLKTEDKQFSIRWSVEPSKPLGIATWRTTGELRDLRWRRLDAPEVAVIEKSAAEP